MENDREGQLAIIAQAREAAADRLVTPWWYHPALGLLLAGYVLALSLGGVALKIAGAVLFIAGSVVLMDRYKRLTGVWISGFEAGGRAAWWARGLGVLAAVAMLTAWGAVYWAGLTWVPWCMAVVALAGTVVAGRQFDVALREQLRAGA